MLKGDRCYTPSAPSRSGPAARATALPRGAARSPTAASSLREKQKARYTYGVLERQFRRYYAEAVRRPGVTGDNLMRLLEMRLDNVVYRLGFADSRAQARQVVRHGHISSTDARPSIPSAQVKLDDVIGWTAARKEERVLQGRPGDRAKSETLPWWLTLDTRDHDGSRAACPELGGDRRASSIPSSSSSTTRGKRWSMLEGRRIDGSSTVGPEREGASD